MTVMTFLDHTLGVSRPEVYWNFLKEKFVVQGIIKLNIS